LSEGDKGLLRKIPVAKDSRLSVEIALSDCMLEAINAAISINGCEKKLTRPKKVYPVPEKFAKARARARGNRRDFG
jgi:hypothetical protein